MSNLVNFEDRAKSSFLEVCNIKRLNALVGEGNSASFLSDFLILAEQNPNADIKNLAKCCVEIASMRLPILKQAGQAYVVPRKGILNVEIGYRGWLVLAKRAGIAVRVIPIYEGDNYSYGFNGFEQRFDFTPADENLKAEKTTEFVDSKLRFIAVLTKDLQTGIENCELVELALLKKLRSKNQTNNGGVYNDWLLEMYKAKAIKYVLKRLPIDTQDNSIYRAFKEDDKNDVGYQQEAAKEVVAPKTSAFTPKPQEIINKDTGEIIEGGLVEIE